MSQFWLSREDVREIDRRSIEEFGVPGIVLMENAGRGCAELLMQLNPERKPVVILCGPGNNGGDGFVIARHLDNLGLKVRIYSHAFPMFSLPSTTSERVLLGYFVADKLPADARINFEIVSKSRMELLPFGIHSSESPEISLSDSLEKQDCWIVDALFGTGLSRALTSPYDELVALVNASSNPVLAVDIPSGLDCDSGEPLGPTIRAKHTATFVAHKRGFLNPESRKWTGEIHVVDIGAPRMLVDEYRNRPR
jgi:NAD(P)H-hydrate epimerase